MFRLSWANPLQMFEELDVHKGSGEEARQHDHSDMEIV
jgi:hypothetical protein